MSPGTCKSAEERSAINKETANQPEVKEKRMKFLKERKVEDRGHKSNCQCFICKAKRGENKTSSSSRLGSNPKYPTGTSTYWRNLSRKKWEETHGQKIPKGMLIHHKDGDVTNIEDDNLQLRTRRGHEKWHRVLSKLIEKIEKIKK